MRFIVFSFFSSPLARSMDIDSLENELGLRQEKPIDYAIQACAYDPDNLLVHKNVKDTINSFVRDGFFKSALLKKILKQSVVEKIDTIIPSSHFNSAHTLSYILDKPYSIYELKLYRMTLLGKIQFNNVLSAAWHPTKNCLVFMQMQKASDNFVQIILLDINEKFEATVNKQWNYQVPLTYNSFSIAWNKGIEKEDRCSILMQQCPDEHRVEPTGTLAIITYTENQIEYYNFKIQTQEQPFKAYQWINKEKLSLFKTMGYDNNKAGNFIFDYSNKQIKQIDLKTEAEEIFGAGTSRISNMHDSIVHVVKNEKNFLINLVTKTIIPLEYANKIVEQFKPNFLRCEVLQTENYGENYFVFFTINQGILNNLHLYNTKLGLIAEWFYDNHSAYYDPQAFKLCPPHGEDILNYTCPIISFKLEGATPTNFSFQNKVLSYHFSRYTYIIDRLDKLSIKETIFLNGIDTSINASAPFYKPFALATPQGDARGIFAKLPLTIRNILKELNYVERGSKKITAKRKVQKQNTMNKLAKK